jgi:hypothetical protein
MDTVKKYMHVRHIATYLMMHMAMMVGTDVLQAVELASSAAASKPSVAIHG